VSGFSAEWLTLREPADAGARSRAVTDFVAAWLQTHRSTPLRLVDLGSGSGSNVRYLSPRLPETQEWLLVDDDRALLQIAAALSGQVRTQLADLRILDTSLFDGRDLVTASALLDLVSEEWLRTLVTGCRDARAAALFALNYDGRLTCSPRDEDDQIVRQLVNAHQRRDKGFGPALGPEAGARVAQLLRGAGYDVRSAKSDWDLGARQGELQRQLISGWARAAAEQSPADASRIGRWEIRRLAYVTAGTSKLIVGHDDVAGLLW
jgi:hypothetical protein